MKCQENLIRVQRLQQWLQDGKRIAQEVCKLEGRCGEEVVVPDRIEVRSL